MESFNNHPLAYKIRTTHEKDTSHALMVSFTHGFEGEFEVGAQFGHKHQEKRSW